MKDHVVWITGGGSGLGRAMAEEFAARGAKVAVSGRRKDRLDETVKRISDAGGTAVAMECDVADEAQQASVLERIISELGRLDVAIANAGFGVAAPFEKITTEQWRKQLEVNVVGVATMLRLTIPELKKTKGRAVVISSVMGKISLAGSSPYCASKFALVGLCGSLHQELYGSGVSLTNICPGLVESEIALVDNDGVFREHRTDRRPKKFMWTGERAAKKMVRAIEKRKREYVFTGHGKVGAFLGQHFPGMAYWFMARAGVRGRG